MARAFLELIFDSLLNLAAFLVAIMCFVGVWLFMLCVFLVPALIFLWLLGLAPGFLVAICPTLGKWIDVD